MDIPTLLTSAHTIAIVGLSGNPDRSSFGVAMYLQDAGYTIIPVNPGIEHWMGIPAVASLRDIDRPVDIVDVFRRPEFAPAIAREAASIGAKALWLQQGIISEEAAAIAVAAGLFVVQDRCIALEHSKTKAR